MELPALRIGNCFKVYSFQTDDGSNIRKVTEISKKQVQLDGKSVSLDNLISINITGEILLQSGFTQFDWIKDSSVFQCNHFKCTLDENGIHIFCDGLKLLKPVKHLHELQNLYYDLTGEELQVDLNAIKSPKKEIA